MYHRYPGPVACVPNPLHRADAPQAAARPTAAAHVRTFGPIAASPDALRLTGISHYCSYSNACESSSIQPKTPANQAKHGVSLALAGELDWDAALVWVDDRFEYDELRMIALAPKTEILYYVAFVDRGEVRRIISLRRANRREVKHYVQSI